MTDRELLERFKPVLFMDSKERVFPTSVDDGRPDVIYARVVTDEGGTWAQYIVYYREDWSPLPWRKGHEHNIEMMQFLVQGEVVILAAYAQHSSGERQNLTDVKDPMAFVARGKHAPYFEPGRYRTGLVDCDLADGMGRRVDAVLEDPPADGWAGRSFGAVIAPGRRTWWRRPSTWARDLKH